MKTGKKPEKVCERVFQVGGPELTSGKDCCVYLIDGGGELALIDAGCGPSYKNLVANVMRLGFEPENIKSVILTHCHICLLYTSDAADDLLCVDLGGRRIIKKKKRTK